IETTARVPRPMFEINVLLKITQATAKKAPNKEEASRSDRFVIFNLL
ncbi:unnamed protein product, partial [Rotaria magnacalcarata]